MSTHAQRLGAVVNGVRDRLPPGVAMEVIDEGICIQFHLWAADRGLHLKTYLTRPEIAESAVHPAFLSDLILRRWEDGLEGFLSREEGARGDT